ncbi:MAG: IS5 family transposase, partial [Lentisphaeria bacterium]
KKPLEFVMFKVRTKTAKTRGFSMRETRVAQVSIFENYSEHEFGLWLKLLSGSLDERPEILDLIALDLIGGCEASGGRTGLSVESIFRCLLLKQQLRVSYEQLAFHLSDSITYRTFTRLPNHLYPSRSTLQATIRRITPETLEKVSVVLSRRWLTDGTISMEKSRIDSTVVASDIAPPSDSPIINDGIRVLSRILAKSKSSTGNKIRFTDQRRKAKSLAFRIFNAKNTEKEALYPDLLKIVRIVIAQVDRGINLVNQQNGDSPIQKKWFDSLVHYSDLTLRVIDQTERRIIHKEKVPSSEKIVSLKITLTLLSKDFVMFSTVTRLILAAKKMVLLPI